MGAFISAMGKVQEFLNCALMVLHHCGKDTAKGLRGHSSLLGAVDTELELLRFDEQMKGVLTVSKQKDGEDNKRFGFEMVEVEIKPLVYSLAVIESDSAVNEGSKKSKNNAGKGRNQSIQLTSLEAIVKDKGIPKFIDGFQRQAVNLSDWKSEFRSRKGITDDSTVNEKKAFDKAWGRAQDDLQRSNEIGIRDKWVWLMPFQSNVAEG